MSIHTHSRLHGGDLDAAWDFSTNANCLGPCPAVLNAVVQADNTRYPDSRYTTVVAQLARWHTVDPERVVLGASASELIMRLHMALHVLSNGRQAQRGTSQDTRPWRIAVPTPAYGDYASSAHACGHDVVSIGQDGVPEIGASMDLQWHALPGSPMGQSGLDGNRLVHQVAGGEALQIVDCAYQPLQLEGTSSPAELGVLDSVWQLWSPNKALGLCGVRGGYAIAPACLPARFSAIPDTLRSLEPSWILGAGSAAMLQAWPSEPVQTWLAATRIQLQMLKARQITQLQNLSITVLPSVTNFMCVQLDPHPAIHQQRLQALRQQGIALRDTISMGLPGWVRMRVHTEQAMDAFIDTWKSVVDL